MNPFRVLWKRTMLERSCRWTRAELERHQARRLAALRAFALARSPFYQRFHRGLERAPLHALPVLTKAVMMENFDDLVTDRAIRLADAEAFLQEDHGGQLFRQRYLVLSTSGSTGRRGVFLFDSAEWLTALAMISRPMAWAGLRRAVSSAAAFRDGGLDHAVALLDAHRRVAVEPSAADVATGRVRASRHDRAAIERLAARSAGRLPLGA